MELKVFLTNDALAEVVADARAMMGMGDDLQVALAAAAARVDLRVRALIAMYAGENRDLLPLAAKAWQEVEDLTEATLSKPVPIERPVVGGQPAPKATTAALSRIRLGDPERPPAVWAWMAPLRLLLPRPDRAIAALEVRVVLEPATRPRQRRA